VFNDKNELLLIRHSYGRSDLYMLPGGGVDKNESPIDAAYRELQEEVQCRAENLKLLGEYFDDSKGAKNTIFVFTATTRDEPIIDGKELIEARFAPLDQLPGNISRATKDRFAESQTKKTPSDRW